MKRGKRLPESPMVSEKDAGAAKHAGDVSPSIDPVDEAVELPPERLRIGFGDEDGGLRTELFEHELDTPSSGDDIAKRKTRSHQPHDFLVLLSHVAMHETDRIAAAGRHRIEVGE